MQKKKEKKKQPKGHSMLNSRTMSRLKVVKGAHDLSQFVGAPSEDERADKSDHDLRSNNVG